VTEEPCLKCHGHQGYKIGDVRGGVSISIPMRDHYGAAGRHRRAIMLSHAVLWVIGVAGIGAFTGRLGRQQRKLTQNEEKYRLLFDNNPHPMWVYDLETLRFLTVNDAAVGHYGYSRDEFLSMTIKDIRPHEDVPRLLENVARVTAGIDKAGVWRHRKKDGSIIYVEITSHVVEFGGKRAELVLANDVTGRLRLEEQFRQAQKMEAVGLLAGGVAHDFNNILTAIIGYGNLMQMKMPAGEPLRTHVDQILSTAEQAAQLTRSLLAFSRKQVLNPAPADLNAVIRKVQKLLKRLIGENIEFRTELGAGDMTVMVDVIQIEQVLMNLATNARDAMPGGGVLTVRSARTELADGFIRSRGYGKPGAYARMSIVDTGVGMDEKTRERIFEPFFTTKELGKGTGLGLATVYGIIKQHDGIIEVESEPGKGSAFHAYLPLVPAAPAGPAAAEPEELKGGTETVLIAEDDEVIRRLTSTVLREFGYTVLEAADGEQAVGLFRGNKDKIGLLLFDVIMPKMSGRDAFEKIRAISPGVKALFISGYSADMISKEGILEPGMNFIAKPVSPKELLKKVREVLDG
jgi:PAS domain S-box-containing protein